MRMAPRTARVLCPMSKALRICGVEVPVVSNEEAEQCDFVVCGSADQPNPWNDNIETVCCACGTPIIHRPHVPEKPPKICMQCVLDRMKGIN